MDVPYAINLSKTPDALGLLMNERLTMLLKLPRPMPTRIVYDAATGAIAAYIKMANTHRVQDDLIFLLDTTSSLTNVAALFL
jgi:hypothetical protein